MTRSRAVPVPPDTIWAIVSDPHHLPRWWPLTERVEAVDPEAWTSVMRSDRGNVVRADYRVEADEPPRRRAWSQALDGTPFERLLREHRTEVALLDGDGGGTVVSLTVTQKGRGTARLGMWMMRRATRRRLDEALDGLEGALA